MRIKEQEKRLTLNEHNDDDDDDDDKIVVFNEVYILSHFTHIINLLSVIHTIYSIIQTKIQGLHVSTVYGHLQALFFELVQVLFKIYIVRSGIPCAYSSSYEQVYLYLKCDVI